MPRESTPASRTGCLVVLLCMGATAPGWSAQGGESQASFQVIVNPSVPGTQIRRQDLAAIFLGERTRWSNRAVIEAVDLSLRSELRQDFSDRVLRLSLLAVQHLWTRQIATGQRRPPLVKATDEEVIAYVAAGPGRIGYVSALTPLPATVKAIKIVD